MELELIIDGKDIPMNNFVQKIISGVVSGTVESLDGVEKDWKEIKLTLTR
jgi:hypothetical protein